jgi:hypothetical protein
MSISIEFVQAFATIAYTVLVSTIALITFFAEYRVRIIIVPRKYRKR